MQKYFHCGMITIGLLLSTLPTSVAENVAETELPVVGEGDSGKQPGSDEVGLQWIPDFLYFFYSSCAKSLSGSDTCLGSVICWGGPSCSCSRKENPSVLHSWCFPAALWAVPAPWAAVETSLSTALFPPLCNSCDCALLVTCLE